MIKTNFLALFILLIPFIANSQNKKDTKIIVTIKDTANLFNRLVVGMFERGYSPEQKDQSLGILTTAVKTLEKGNLLVKYRIMIKDSAVIMSGDFALNAEFELYGVRSPITYTEIYFGGMKGSYLRKAWNEMDEIAKQFGEVSYSK